MSLAAFFSDGPTNAAADCVMRRLFIPGVIALLCTGVACATSRSTGGIHRSPCRAKPGMLAEINLTARAADSEGVEPPSPEEEAPE
jgi:hypothetical protein